MERWVLSQFEKPEERERTKMQIYMPVVPYVAPGRTRKGVNPHSEVEGMMFQDLQNFMMTRK